MKTVGQISAVESTIEDVVRKIARDNDAPIERLSRSLGRAEEENNRLRERIANLEFDKQQLQADLDDERAAIMMSRVQGAA